MKILFTDTQRSSLKNFTIVIWLRCKRQVEEVEDKKWHMQKISIAEDQL